MVHCDVTDIHDVVLRPVLVLQRPHHVRGVALHIDWLPPNELLDALERVRHLLLDSSADLHRHRIVQERCHPLGEYAHSSVIITCVCIVSIPPLHPFTRLPHVLH